MSISMKSNYIAMPNYNFAISSNTYTSVPANKLVDKPLNATFAIIRAWGGGGSGGSKLNTADGYATGGGGGAGFFGILYLPNYPQTFLRIEQIGAGGPAVSSPSSGNSGSSTEFYLKDNNGMWHGILLSGGEAGQYNSNPTGGVYGGKGGVVYLKQSEGTKSNTVGVFSNSGGVGFESSPTAGLDSFAKTQYFHGGSGAGVSTTTLASLAQGGSSFFGGAGGACSPKNINYKYAGTSFGSRYANNNTFSTTGFGAGSNGMVNGKAGAPGAICITYI